MFGRHPDRQPVLLRTTHPRCTWASVQWGLNHLGCAAMAARRQRSAPGASFWAARIEERLYQALNGSSAVRVARSPAASASWNAWSRRVTVGAFPATPSKAREYHKSLVFPEAS